MTHVGWIGSLRVLPLVPKGGAWRQRGGDLLCMGYPPDTAKKWQGPEPEEAGRWWARQIEGAHRGKGGGRTMVNQIFGEARVV